MKPPMESTGTRTLNQDSNGVPVFWQLTTACALATSVLVLLPGLALYLCAVLDLKILHLREDHVVLVCLLMAGLFIAMSYAAGRLILSQHDKRILAVPLPTNRKAEISHYSVILYALTCVVFALFLSRYLPLFSWDGIDWWGRIAHRVAVTQTIKLPPEAWVNISTPTWGLPSGSLTGSIEYSGVFAQSHYHPPTLSYVLAAWALIASALDFNVTGVAWLLAWFSIFLVTVGLAYAQGAGMFKSLLLASLTFSIPILENHALVWGYAEIWLTLFSLFSISFGYIFVKTFQRKYLIATVIFLVAMPWLKNTGLINSLIIAFSLIFSTLIRSFSLKVASLRVLGIASGFCLVIMAFQLSPGGNLLHIDIHPEFVIHMAGRAIRFSTNNAQQVGANLVQAVFVNASFSLLWLAFLLIILAQLRDFFSANRKAKGSVYSLESVFIVITVVSHMGVYIGGQFFYQYLYESSLPGRDTGLSRLLLVVAPIIMSLTATPFQQVSKEVPLTRDGCKNLSSDS